MCVCIAAEITTCECVVILHGGVGDLVVLLLMMNGDDDDGKTTASAAAPAIASDVHLLHLHLGIAAHHRSLMDTAAAHYTESIREHPTPMAYRNRALLAFSVRGLVCLVAD